MRELYRISACVMFFPLDLMRLTLDAWAFTLEGYSYRFLYKKKDQPCIYCRGFDCGVTPRAMHTRIRYWNLWMVRILHPNLKAIEARQGLRHIPICHEEGGHLHTPAYVPLVAIVCSLLWGAVLFWGLSTAGFIPPEILASVRK